MDTQLAAHTTCVGFTHPSAWCPCDPMWLAHGGMLQPDWAANPQQLHMCSVAACWLHAVCSNMEHHTLWIAMLELFCVLTSDEYLLPSSGFHLLVLLHCGHEFSIVKANYQSVQTQTTLGFHQYPVGCIGYPAATDALLEQGTERVQ